MKNYAANFSKLINSLSKDDFDLLVKEFIKTFLDVDIALIVDGPNDAGLDIRIIDKNERIKIPVQITVNRNLISKLNQDLKKISDLVIKHRFSSSFYFFYSQTVSEKKILELEKIARNDFGIELKLFDSNLIGEYLEKDDYIDVREVLRKILGVFQIPEKTQFSLYNKMRFDLIYYGSDTFEIKSRIIESFILHYLFIKNEIKRDIISSIINKEFGIDDPKFCERFIGKLLTEKKIKVDDNDRTIIILPDDEKKKINSLKEQVEWQEQYLYFRFEQIFKNYGINNVDISRFVQRVFKVYKTNYKQDYFEITDNVNNGIRTSNALKEIEEYLVKLTIDKSSANYLSKEIVEVCEVNDILQRIAAGELFSSFLNSSHLNAYINRRQKDLYLDTPVILYLICGLYNSNSKYDNIYYKTANDLLDAIANNSNLKFKISTFYLEESSHHLFRAYKLSEFTDLPFFYKLGRSNNVFYNFYNFLSRESELEEGINTFRDFLSDIGINEDMDIDEEMFQYTEEVIKNILTTNGLDILYLYKYAKDVNSTKKFSEIQKSLEKSLLVRQENRAPLAIYKDSLMLSYLYDERHDKADPTLITWDNSFYSFRKNYHKKHPGSSYWHLFRPGKFLDHIALLNLSINSTALHRDILSLMGEEFGLQQKVKALNDTLTKIIDLKTETGISLTKKIGEIRENYIYQIRKEEKQEITFEDVQPLDNLIIELTRHYQFKSDKFTFADFRNTLNNEMVLDRVVSYFESELSNILKNNQINKDFKLKMDDIIMQSKENKDDTIDRN